MTVRLLRSFLRPYRGALLVVVLLLGVQALGSLTLPALNAEIIDRGVIPGDLGVIVRTGVVMLILSLIVGGFSVTATYFAARTAMRFGRDVRRALFGQVQTFSVAEINRFGAPSLITRNTNDVQQLQMLVLTGQTMMVSAPLMAVGGVFMALQQNVALSLLILVIVPFMAVVVGLILRRALPLFRAMQQRLDGVNDVLREQLSGIRVIRAFVRTGYEARRFDRANSDLTEVTLRVTRLFALMMPALMLVFNLSSVAVIWFGGQLVADQQMQIGDLTAFLAYIMQILFSVMMAVMLLVMIPRAAASAERVGAVLATEPAIVDPAGGPAPAPGRAEHIESAPEPSVGAEVRFMGTGFSYPGAEAPVLSDINLTMRPGTTTAIVGSTGSGKSTLVTLIPRLLDATAGSVSVAGVDVRRWSLEQLWAQLGYVPQRAFLFTGTIAENVRFGAPEASDEQVWQALQTAQAADFVRALPDELAAPVEQGGANLSGGQRQRLAIARAVVRRPAVYILDDTFSALDYSTDAKVRLALARITRGATVITVAQRVSTIMAADQIAVLDRGRLAAVGQHDELLATCPTYAEIVMSQGLVDEVQR